MTSQEPLEVLKKKYLHHVQCALEKELLQFAQSIVSTTVCPVCFSDKRDNSHKDKLFEWTTHPSQTWDTLVQQEKNVRKNQFESDFIEDFQNNFTKQSRSMWANEISQKFAQENAQKIRDKCEKRLFSLENAKIPAHSQMTPELLKKTHQFFEVFDRYNNLPTWKQEEKAEEKNISFLAFLNEEHLPQVYLDERIEAVNTAKKILTAGENRFYMWIDFDGAKRPDGIMLSIFAHMLIDDIDTGGQGISEQTFVLKNSLFTLSEREYNRRTVQKFQDIDRCIYALTRQMASEFRLSENPVCIHQMEILKKKRERYLRKIVQIKETMQQRRKEKKLSSLPFLSERSHFIPRFDPEFITALRKSNLGEQLEHLNRNELHNYNTVSHIIDQILVVNKLSPDMVCQIIIAQCTGSKDITTLEHFLERKVKQWREKQSQYFAEDPLQKISICPLFETDQHTQTAFIKTTLEELKLFYDQKSPELFSTRIQEFFFAGSDLSKSIGSSSAYLNTWKCANEIEIFNEKNGTDVRVKLGSGESYFRQNGFLDPRFQDSIWNSSIQPQQKKPSGYLSLISKSPWLNSITLQSKAREWMQEIPKYSLPILLSKIRYQKEKNNMNGHKYQAIAPGIEFFAQTEKEIFEKIIGKESDKGKKLCSYPSLIELFSTQLMPVLRDRALKREKIGIQENSKEKLTSHRGINTRAIAGNTTSSFLFPLALLGKGSAFLKCQQQYSHKEIIDILSFWEPEELLIVIHQASAIVPQFIELLRTCEIHTLANFLQTEWSGVQGMIPFLQQSIWSLPPFSNIPPGQQEESIPLLSSRYQILLSSEPSLQKDQNIVFIHQSWETLAKPIVQKALLFINEQGDQQSFTRDDYNQWNLFMTMACRMRWDAGILG